MRIYQHIVPIELTSIMWSKTFLSFALQFSSMCGQQPMRALMCRYLFILLPAFLASECGRQITFQESMLLKYSTWGYSNIPSNYNCMVTILSTSPGRGIQVRFRTLETTYTASCSQVRLTVGDRTGSLTRKHFGPTSYSFFMTNMKNNVKYYFKKTSHFEKNHYLEF